MFVNKKNLKNKKALTIGILSIGLVMLIGVTGVLDNSLKAGDTHFQVANSKGEAESKVAKGNGRGSVADINSDFQAHFVKGTSVILKNNDKYYYNQGYYTTYNKDGKVVYCLNPYVLADKVKAELDINDGEVFQKLDKDNILEIEKYARVANKLYEDSKDEKYLLAGQVEVWKVVGVEVAEVSEDLDKYLAKVEEESAKAVVEDSEYKYLDTNGQDLVEDMQGSVIDPSGEDGNTDNGGDAVDEKVSLKFAGTGSEAIGVNDARGILSIKKADDLKTVKIELSKVGSRGSVRSYELTGQEVEKINNGEAVNVEIDNLDSNSEYAVSVVEDGQTSVDIGNIYTDKESASGSVEYVSNTASSLNVDVKMNDSQAAIEAAEVVAIDEKGEEKVVKVGSDAVSVAIEGLAVGRVYDVELRAEEQLDNKLYGDAKGETLAEINDLRVGMSDKLEYEENAKDSITEDKVSGKIGIDSNKTNVKALEVRLVPSRGLFGRFKNADDMRVYKFSNAEVNEVNNGEEVGFSIGNLESNQGYKIEVVEDEVIKNVGELYTDRKAGEVSVEYLRSGIDSLSYEFKFVDEDDALDSKTKLHVVSKAGAEKEQEVATKDGVVKVKGLKEDTEYKLEVDNLEQIDNERYGKREEVKLGTIEGEKTLSVKDLVNVVVSDDSYVKVDGQELSLNAQVKDKGKILKGNKLKVKVGYTNADEKEVSLVKAVKMDEKGNFKLKSNLSDIVHDSGRILNIEIYGDVKTGSGSVNEEIWNRNIGVPKKVLIKGKEYYTLSGCDAFMGMGENKVIDHILYPNDENYTIGKDLICDKSLKANRYEPISNYKGDFNGQNHQIGYINIALGEEDNVGLFKELEGEVSNVTLDHLEIEGKDNVGGVVGKLTNTEARTIENLEVINSKIVGDNYVGGVVGSYSEGDATGEKFTKFINPKIVNTEIIGNGTVGYTGGFAGSYDNKKVDARGEVSIENAFEENNYISGNGSYVGGIAGLLKGNVNQGKFVNNEIKTATRVAGWEEGLGFVGGIGGQSYGRVENVEVDNLKMYGGIDCGAIAGENYGNTNNNVIKNAEIEVYARDGGAINGESFPGTENNYNRVENARVSVKNEGAVGIGINQGEMKENIIAGKLEKYNEYPSANSMGGVVGINTKDGNVVDNTFSGDVSGIVGVGGIVGKNQGSVNGNSLSESKVVGETAVGGLTGLEEDGKVSNYSGHQEVEVTGENYVGGVVGEITSTDKVNINGIEMEGKVVGDNSIGGIVGKIVDGEVNITNSYNNEVLNGAKNIGGLIGENIGVGTYVTNSYYSGNIQGEEYVGGLIGKNSNKLQLQNSFYYPKAKVNTNTQRYENPIGVIGESNGVEATYQKIYKNMVTYLDSHDNVTYNEINEVNKGYYNSLSSDERSSFEAGFVSGDSWSIKGMIDNVELIANEEAQVLDEAVDSTDVIAEANAEIILMKELEEEIRSNSNKEEILGMDEFLNPKNKEDKYEYQSACWKEDKTSDFPLVYEGKAGSCQIEKKYISDKEVNAKIVVDGTDKDAIKANSVQVKISEDSIEDIVNGALVVTNVKTKEEQRVVLTDSQKDELNKRGMVSISVNKLESNEEYQISLDLKTTKGIGYLEYTPLKITTDKVAAKVDEFKVSSGANGIAVKLNIIDEDKAIENNQVHVKLLKGSSVVADKIVGSAEDMTYFMNGDEYAGNELTLTPGETYQVRLEYNYQLEPEYVEGEVAAHQYLNTTVPKVGELKDLEYTLKPQEDMVSSITTDSVQGIIDLQKDEDMQFITSQNQIVDSVQVSMIEEVKGGNPLRKLFPKVITKKVALNNGKTLIRMEDLESNTMYKVNLGFMTADNNLVKADTYEIQTDKKTPVVKSFEEVTNSDDTYSINYEIDDEDHALNDLKLLTKGYGSYSEKEQVLDVNATEADVVNVVGKADFEMGITGSYETDKYHSGEDNQTNKKLLLKTNGDLAYQEVRNGIHSADTKLAVKVKDSINGIHADSVDLNVSVNDSLRDRLTEVDINLVSKGSQGYKLTDQELNTLKTKGNVDIRINDLAPNTKYEVQYKLVSGFSTINPEEVEVPDEIITDKAVPEVRVMSNEVHADKIDIGVEVEDQDQAIVNNYLTYKLIGADGSEITQVGDSQTKNIEFRGLDKDSTYKLEVSGEVAANNPKYEPAKETMFYTKEYHTLKTKQAAEVKLEKDTGIVAGEDVFKIVVNVHDIDHVIQDNHLKVTLRYQNGIMPMKKEEMIVYEEEGDNEINIPLDRLKYNGRETLGFSVSGEVEGASGIEEEEFIKEDGIEIVHQRKEDDGIYLDIDTCGNLEAIGKKVNYVEYPTDGKYDIVNNLDCTDVDKVETFDGEMDGNNKTISNIDITEVGKNVGLIGTNSGTIKNLEIADPKVVGSSNVGGLVGENTGKLENINIIKTSGGADVSGDSEVGGLVGENKGDLEDIKVSGVRVSATSTRAQDEMSLRVQDGGLVGKGNNIGGVVGSSDKITTNYNNIEGEDLEVVGNSNVGGLVGSNTNGKFSNLKVNNVQVSGDTIIGNNIGGVIGSNENAILENIETSGVKAEGEAFVGGVVGSNMNADISGIEMNGIDLKAVGSNAGGLAGKVLGSNIEDIEADTVDMETSGDYVGGIVGENKDSLINDIKVSNIDMKVSGSNVGGIVGSNTKGEEKNTVDNIVTISKIDMKDVSVEQTASEKDSEVKENYGAIAGSNAGDVEEVKGEGLNITADNVNNVGGVGINRGKIDGVNLSNVNISTGDYSKNVGGVIGTQYGDMNDVTIINSNVKGKMGNIGTSNVGGVVGLLQGSLLYNQVEVNVEGYENVGGIIGTDFTPFGEVTETKENLNNNKVKQSESSKTKEGVINTVRGNSGVGGIIGTDFNEIIESNVVNNRIVEGTIDTGGIVGWNNGAKIDGTINNGTIKGGNYTGGITGESSVNLTNVINTGEIRGGSYTGGIVGYSGNHEIERGINSGKVVGMGNYTGGIVGYNGSPDEVISKNQNEKKLKEANFKSVSESKNTGDVIGENYVGGLAGYNIGKILNSYATSKVEGVKDIGGLVGWNEGLITEAYFTGGVFVPENPRDQNAAEYVGSIAGCQSKNFAYGIGGSENKVFYDPVYLRTKEDRQTLSYAYSFDNFVGQPHEETQSYIKYKEDMDKKIKAWVKANPNSTEEEKSQEIHYAAKQHFKSLSKEDKNIVVNANKPNDEWYISENDDNSLVYTDEEYNFVNNSSSKKNQVVKKSVLVSGLKIVGKYVLKQTIGIVIDEMIADKIPEDATIGEQPQSGFYKKYNLENDYFYDENIWDLNNINIGSNEPIKLKFEEQ